MKKASQRVPSVSARTLTVSPRRSVRFRILLAAVLLVLAAPAFGQALPAAEASPISTGFSLPKTAGTLQYAVSASESLSWGYYGNSGASASTNVSGDLAYISNSTRDPFSAIISGGYSWATSNQASYSFFSAGLSQVMNTGRWNFVVADSASYLPASPIAGLSGIAGVGDLGVSPIQVGVDVGQPVLTNYSTRIGNTASGSLERKLTARTTLNGSGSYTIMRFVGDSSDVGIDNDSVAGSGGFTHQMSVRNSFGGNYGYSRFSFSGNNLSTGQVGVISQTASGTFSHQFTRRLSLSVSAGPQWTRLDTPTSKQLLSAYADVGATYTGHFSQANLSYVRSTNAGYGVIGGSLSDGVTFSGNRVISRVWNAAVNASYTHTSSLAGTGIVGSYTFNTTVGGVQVARALMRSLSCYASYTAENQSSRGTVTTYNVFSGFSQVIGFGVTYSPMALHVGRP